MNSDLDRVDVELDRVLIQTRALADQLAASVTALVDLVETFYPQDPT